MAALRPYFVDGIGGIPAQPKPPTSALDTEAMAEAEEIREQNAIHDTLGHEVQEGEEEAWNNAAKMCKEELLLEKERDGSAMDAETERAAQIKRTLDAESDSLVDDDIFSLQEQEDIQKALELSRADQGSQEAAAPGAKKGRLSEASPLSGTELAAKALEDLEAARKEIEAKPGSADPAATNSASSSSNGAAPAGGDLLDGVGHSSSSTQGATATASG